MKVILQGEYDNYEQALGVLNLESLDQRRESMALKFVKNGLKDHYFSKLFPLRKVQHGMIARNREKYHINKSNTSRYEDSSVPFLQRLLNKDSLDKKMRFKSLVSGIEASKKTKRRVGDDENPSFRVNYVCNVDAIT